MLAIPSTPSVNDLVRPSSTQPSPCLSDDSALDLPDFPYFTNSQGDFVRVKTPSPDNSPSPTAGIRRVSLSRSESAPSIVDPPAMVSNSTTTLRHFTRVSSVPVNTQNTPGATVTATYLARSSGLTTAARKFTSAPRRVMRLGESDEYGKENGDAIPIATGSTNVRPLAEVIPVPQRSVGRPVLPVPTRAVNRLLKKVEPIAEVDDAEEIPQPRPSLTGIRPRRSASLSEAPDDNSYLPFRNLQLGPRRVTLEEKLKREREIALEEGYARALAEREQERMQEQQQYQRQSPSPTHVNVDHAPPHLRPIVSLQHTRKDSDTVVTSNSPTIVEKLPARISPPHDPLARLSQGELARHRRSPTVPDREPPAPVEISQAKQHEEYYNMANQPPPQQQMHLRQSQPMPPQQQLNGRQIIINKKTYTRLDMIGKGGSSKVYRVLTPGNEMLALKRVALDQTDKESMAGYMNEIGLLRRLDGNKRIIRLFDSELRSGSGSKGTLCLLMELGEIDLAKLLHEQLKRPMDFVWVAYYFKQMLQAVHIIHEEKIVHSDLKPANFVLVKGQLKLIDFGIANAIANDTTNIHREHQIGTVNYMSPEAIEFPDGMRRLKVGRASDVWSLGCILYQMVYGHPPFHYCSTPLLKMKNIPDPNVPINFPTYIEQTVEPVDAKLASADQQEVQEPVTVRVRVPDSLINSMKRCLLRNPKERATIPELLAESWLTMHESESSTPSAPSTPKATPPAPTPSLLSLLREDQAVLNVELAKQLLNFAADYKAGGHEITDDIALHVIKQLQQVNADTLR